MLINLLPDFLAVLGAGDREAAYRQYHESHRPILDAYWRNYVLDPDSPHAGEIVTAALRADRSDLLTLADSADLVQLAEDAIAKAEELLLLDRPTDTYLMVGLGGANAGELVVGGRGIAFICLEHFTGRVNPETYGMGLPPDLIPLWIGHELAHTVRYTSATSGERHAAAGGRSGRLLRLLVDGQPRVAPGAAGERGARRACGAGGGPGLRRRRLLRLSRAASTTGSARWRRSSGAWSSPTSSRVGLGLRLRYLSGGMSPTARLVGGRVLPERAGYYLGYRMSEALVAERGLAAALRAPALDFQAAEDVARGIQTA